MDGDDSYFRESRLPTPRGIPEPIETCGRGVEIQTVANGWIVRPSRAALTESAKIADPDTFVFDDWDRCVAHLATRIGPPPEIDPRTAEEIEADDSLPI